MIDHSTLHFDGAAYRFDRAGELAQRAVSRGLGRSRPSTSIFGGGPSRLLSLDFDRHDGAQWPAYFVVLEFTDGAVVCIRDFPLPALRARRGGASSDGSSNSYHATLIG